MTLFESRDAAANTPGRDTPPRPVCVPKTKPPWTGGTRYTAERRRGPDERRMHASRSNPGHIPS